MGLGGNPYGPAGTGKTESVKALGGLLGRQVLVFNCDEVNIVLHDLLNGYLFMYFIVQYYILKIIICQVPFDSFFNSWENSLLLLFCYLNFNSILFNFKGIDVKSMGRIFVGLVKCGAWGCFDEFNRLEEAVLSAVSMQIQTIQHALKKHSPSCELLGKKVHQNLLFSYKNSL